MNQSKRYFSFLFLSFLIAATLSTVHAQSDPGQLIEPSFEVSLHVVIGSNEAGSGVALPSGLAGVSKQLKGSFPFTNYRLANTFLGRISNNGNIEYKSISNILGEETDAESQTFLEWSMVGFRAAPRGFQARTFRFGARVPVRVGSSKDDAGRASPVINYESVGLSMTTIGLPANTPTLVGTISLPKTSGTIFLVATIRSAEL